MAYFLNVLRHSLKNSLIDTEHVSQSVDQRFEGRHLGGTGFEPFLRTTQQLSNLLDDLAKTLALINGSTWRFQNRLVLIRVHRFMDAD
jgi:hypothetical protein